MELARFNSGDFRQILLHPARFFARFRVAPTVAQLGYAPVGAP
jgi:hypothetical protein